MVEVRTASRSSGVAASEEPGQLLAGAVMAVVIVLWGLGPPIAKLITAPAMVSASVRFWISAPVLLVLAAGRGRPVDRAVLRVTALPGFMFGLNMIMVFAALHRTTVAVVSVLMALQPGIVLVAAGPWLGERATRWHIGWTVVGITAVAAVILGGGADIRGDVAGIALAIGALLTFTVYYVLNRQVRSTTAIDPIQWMAGVTVFAAVTVTPLALLTSSRDDYRQLAGADWLYLGFMALMVGIIGHSLMSWSHRFLAASRSSLYLLAMNVVAVGAAWPIHHEAVTVLQALGGLVVLGSVAAVVSRPAAVLVRRDLAATP